MNTMLIRVLLAGVTLAAMPRPIVADEVAPVRLVPEWELNGPIVLVWPEHLRGHSRDLPLFTDLIRALPDEREVAVISPQPPSIRALQQAGRDIRYLPISRVRNVHVRDWAGLPAVDAEGRLFAAKFRYQPNHLTGRDVARAYDNNNAGKELGEALYGTVKEIPLTLSGSAITHNGKGAAIISQRVIGENEHLSIQAIRDVLREHVGLTRTVFVPVRPGDQEGHLTGLIRFASENTVLITKYGDDDTDLAVFADRLTHQVRRELGRGFRVVRIPHSSTDGGGYMDYIALNKHVLVPVYGRSEDDDALETLSKALPDKTITPIPSEIARSLAQEGFAPTRISTAY